jgi:integrase
LENLDPIAQLLQLSTITQSTDTALRRPLADLVASTLQIAGRSTATQRSYQTAIGLFVQYLDRMRGGQLPEEAMISWRPFAETSVEAKKTLWAFRPPSVVLRLVDAAVLDGFRAWRESEGDSSTTATIRTYAVRTLLAVAHRDGVLTADQARTMNIKIYQSRTAQVKQPVGRRLTRSEVRLLRSVVDTTTAKGKRDLAILDTMLFLGLRREEVADLRLTSFRQDGGRWWVVFPGKRDKVRRLKVHDVLFQSLTAWLNVAELAFGQSGPVFRSFDRGDHVTSNCIDASVIGRLVSSYGFSGGLAPERGENQLSPHDLRRTCARNAYDNGASLLLVQAMLGHEDPKTTAHYIGAFESDEDTAVDYVGY